jgi:[ribosomal protein S5]-alanine N-acetyltransferase
LPTTLTNETATSGTTDAQPLVCEVVASRVPQPTLTSERFQYRPFTLMDIRKLVAIAGQDQVGITSIGIPHPHTTEFARMWSSGIAVSENPRTIHWAATKFGDRELSGYAGLNRVDQERRQAELRIWVGSYCGEHCSYATEWSAAVLQFALVSANLGRIYALQLARHPIAGQVLSAIGMQRDGLLRRRMLREGPFEEVVCWTILKEEWLANHRQ